MTLKTLIPQDMSKAVLLIVLKVFKGLNFFYKDSKLCSSFLVQIEFVFSFLPGKSREILKTIVITHRYFDHHHDSLYQPLS